MIPPVHISDNLRLKPREYVFSLRGLEIGRWQTEGAQLLAVSGEPGRRPLAGRETREPAFGVPAVWISPALEEQAVAAGYSVVDAATVITTHLGRADSAACGGAAGPGGDQALDGALNDSHPKLIEELVPKLLTLGEVGRVLEQLLRERVSIRDLGSILEALLETAPMNKSPVPGGSLAAGDGAEPGAAAARRRGTTAGASCSMPRSRRRSVAAFARRRGSGCSARLRPRARRWCGGWPIL